MFERQTNEHFRQESDMFGEKVIRPILKPNLPTSSDTKRAGIEFSVGLVHERLKSNVPPSHCISRETSVYLAAVLEYLVAETLHVAAIAATRGCERHIRSVHLQQAIKDDEELRRLIIGNPFDASLSSMKKEDSSYPQTYSDDSC